MGQSNGNNNNVTDKPNSSNDDKIEENEDWRNEHGEPDIKYLQSLAADGSQEALEKLKSIAADMDVEFDPDTPAGELVERIRLAVKNNEDEGNQDTT